MSTDAITAWSPPDDAAYAYLLGAYLGDGCISASLSRTGTASRSWRRSWAEVVTAPPPAVRRELGGQCARSRIAAAAEGHPSPMDADLLAAARAALLSARAIVPHTDADGLAAGAMALRARGEGAESAVLLGRGEVPWGRDFGGPVALLDWGVRHGAPPGVIVDHHAPEVSRERQASGGPPHGETPELRRERQALAAPSQGETPEIWRERQASGGPSHDEAPEGATGSQTIVVSSYGEAPEVSTAPLLRRLLPEAPAWLAAVGAVGDLGDAGFALPECAGAPKTAVRKLIPLVNAPRRLVGGPVRTALALLCEHADPRAALRDPRIGELEAARRAWRGAFERAVRTPPRVGEQVAVIRFDEPFQIHPLVATTWSRRLAPRVVLAANDGWLPGRVNFAVRGGPPGTDLRALLRNALPGEPGEFAHGHARATGGSLAPERFAALLDALCTR